MALEAPQARRSCYETLGCNHHRARHSGGNAGDALLVQSQQRAHSFGHSRGAQRERGIQVGGRVAQVNVLEGDQVRPGQVILTFEDSELNARLLSARGKVRRSQGQLRESPKRFPSQDIAEARGTAEYQERLADTHRADVERAKADLANADASYRRAQELARSDVVSKQYLDDAENRYKAAQAALESYQHALSASQGTIAASEAAKKRAERGLRPEDIAMAKAQMISAEGDLSKLSRSGTSAR